MKRYFIFLLLGMICFFNGRASDSLQISLMTCSVGKQLYASFGHSALRIQNFTTGKDQVYNFGMFNPDESYFPFKFIQGKAQYELGIQAFDDFLQIYRNENRAIVEQILDLTQEEKEKIVNRLKYLYLPQNRYYFYRFETNNCTTALRDLIFGIVRSDANYFEQPSQKTFRQLLNEYLAGKSWLSFGINLLLGSKADKSMNYYESLFLPEQLRAEINNTTQNGKKLVREEKTLNIIETKGFQYQKVFNPFLIFSLLLLLVLFCKSEYLKSGIFLIVGLLGIILLIIGFFTEHVELKNNFNLLWFSPLYLAFPLLGKQKSIQKYLAYCNLILTAIAFILWITGVQSFPPMFVPLMLTLYVCNIHTVSEKRKIFLNNRR